MNIAFVLKVSMEGCVCVHVLFCKLPAVCNFLFFFAPLLLLSGHIAEGAFSLICCASGGAWMGRR